jgi:hypothetical protein
MKVVLYGATGMVGSRILKELVSRGHEVKAIARDSAKVMAGDKVEALPGDIFDSADVAAKTKGADAVISAFSPGVDPGKVGTLVDATKSLIDGLRSSGVGRVIMVGGAGTMYVAPGVTLIDSGHLPAEWLPIAIAHRDALAVLRESGLEWTSVSPAAFIEPGERTGKFRTNEEFLVMDASGTSRISAEDYAVALVDELETSKHIGGRFTVGY